MKIFLTAGSVILALGMPAYAEDVTDHAAHHPTVTTSPADQPASAGPSGTMSCPMMKDGKTVGTSNGAMMQGGMMQGGETQNGMMDSSHMTQCPMKQVPGGATASPSPPAPTRTDAAGHAEHHPEKP